MKKTTIELVKKDSDFTKAFKETFGQGISNKRLETLDNSSLSAANKVLNSDFEINFVRNDHKAKVGYQISIDNKIIGSIQPLNNIEPGDKNVICVYLPQSAVHFGCKTFQDAFEMTNNYIKNNKEIVAKLLAYEIQLLKENPNRASWNNSDEIFHASINGNQMSIYKNKSNTSVMENNAASSNNTENDEDPIMSGEEIKNLLLENVNQMKERHLRTLKKINNYGDAFDIFIGYAHPQRFLGNTQNYELYHTILETCLKQTKIGYDLNANVRVSGVNVDNVIKDVHTKLVDNIHNYDLTKSKSKVKSKKNDNSNDSGMSM